MAELKVGDKAPVFELPVTLEETWKLSDHIGKKNIVLIFFPFAFSPPCHEELCSLRDGFTEYEALNATVVGIVRDDDLGERVGHVAQQRANSSARLLGEPGHLHGNRLEIALVVNAVVRRLDRPPLQVGIAGGRGGTSGQQQRHEQQRRPEPTPRLVSPADSPARGS